MAGAGAATLPGLGNRPRPGDGQFGDRVSNRLPDRNTPIGDRQQALKDRMSNRDEIRDQYRDRLEDRHDDIRQDWEDWHHDNWENHGDWHHGYWHGNYGAWWDHMWDDHTAAMVLGVTAWGVNVLGNAFGCWNYNNPYYSEPYAIGGDTTLDYSEPLEVTSSTAPAETTEALTAAPAAAEPPPTPGMAEFDAARTAFAEGKYQNALTQVDKALVSMPRDAVLHEFRALTFFALGMYRDAAATLSAVLAVGPGWDWTTMISLYSSQQEYVKQLHALQDYSKQHPDAADAHFVLAYHYLTASYTDEAAAELETVLKLQPRDTVAQQLLQMLAGPDAVAKATGTKVTPLPAEGSVTIDPAQVVGSWKAQGPDNAQFVMSLGQDGAFTWKYSQGGKQQTMKGAYAVDGNTLALQPDSGGVLVADISPPQGGAMDFRIVGTPPTDPGLKFRR